jgi:tRNA (guanosine-2'-O-)-methyltransferase
MHRHRSRARRSELQLERVLAIGFALHLLGCGSASQQAPGAESVGALGQRRQGSDSHPFGDVSVNPKAVALKTECDYGSYEQCNALDEDCNGVIDDECGYEGGEVQVTVAWNTGADIDLYVTDPSGSTLYYNEKHKRSSAGGHLDHDARGDCRREQSNPRVENVYWPSPAPAGKYRIELNYFSPCAQEAPTDATLSVVVDREILGSYRFRLDPEQRIDALTFVKR